MSDGDLKPGMLPCPVMLTETKKCMTHVQRVQGGTVYDGLRLHLEVVHGATEAEVERALDIVCKARS